MNKEVKWLIEEIIKFNPVDYADNDDTNILDNNEVCQVLYKYHPKNYEELKFLVTAYLTQEKTDFNDIDVSAITDFSFLFYGQTNMDIDISDWNVSNGRCFKYMFYGCKKFNCDISEWDVSNGIDFSFMFAGCIGFNCDLSKWDLAAAKNLSGWNHRKYNIWNFIIIISREQQKKELPRK